MVMFICWMSITLAIADYAGRNKANIPSDCTQGALPHRKQLSPEWLESRWAILTTHYPNTSPSKQT